MLSRVVKFIRRWLAPAVLVVSLLLLAVMLVWIVVIQSGGYSWGRTWGNPWTEVEYSISYDSDQIHFWHNDVVESLVGPATAKINADLKSVALHDPRFPFKPEFFEIGFDSKDPVDLLFFKVRWGDLRFSWDHLDSFNFLGPPIGTYLIVDMRPSVPAALLALLAICSGIDVLHRSIKHLRLRSGICRNCSYNLTGNISGVCPECGERFINPGKITA